MGDREIQLSGTRTDVLRMFTLVAVDSYWNRTRIILLSFKTP